MFCLNYIHSGASHAGIRAGHSSIRAGGGAGLRARAVAATRHAATHHVLKCRADGYMPHTAGPEKCYLSSAEKLKDTQSSQGWGGGGGGGTMGVPIFQLNTFSIIF